MFVHIIKKNYICHYKIQFLKTIIISNEKTQYGTNDKMILDTYRFIKACKWYSLPKNIPYEMFPEENGLIKPSEWLQDESWKKLQRRSFIRKLKDKKKQYFWKTTDSREMELKKKLLKSEKKPEFDILTNKFNLFALDAELSKKYKWDEQDIKDNCCETMEDRHLRKKKKILDQLYSQYNPKGRSAAQYPELKNLTKDITNTFKTMAYINAVWKASPRHWLSVFFNAGSYYLMESKFKKTSWKHFDFVNEKGIFVVFI